MRPQSVLIRGDSSTGIPANQFPCATTRPRPSSAQPGFPVPPPPGPAWTPAGTAFPLRQGPTAGRGEPEPLCSWTSAPAGSHLAEGGWGRGRTYSGGGPRARREAGVSGEAAVGNGGARGAARSLGNGSRALGAIGRRLE